MMDLSKGTIEIGDPGPIPEGMPLFTNPLPGPIAFRIPERDRWAMNRDTRVKTIEDEIVRRHRLSRHLLRPENAVERQEFENRCRESPEFFFKNCIWTKDPERRLSLGLELPLIPYTCMLEPVPLKEGVIGGGWVRMWHEALCNTTPGTEVRLLHEKGRRLLMSITAMGFYVWAMRFVPGFYAWVSSDRDKAIDHGDDWDALLGKFRYMWGKCHEFYPWLYPALPKKGAATNKDLYVEFHEWREGGKPVAKEMWGNKINGYVPSDVAGRGGAARMGFIDEAAWIENLSDFLDSIEEMTPFLVLASTPPRGAEHPFALRAFGYLNYTITTTHWTMNPVFAEGIYWDPHGEVYGPYTEQWRSPYYVQARLNRPAHVIARNLDLDYRSTAGSRIFVGFNPATTVPGTDPKASNASLYDPSWRLEIWVDVGRRDPWACIWAMVSDATGEIRIVDYWMRSGVDIQWWIPMWLGWNPDSKAQWRTFPEYNPWAKEVPYVYGPEDLAFMRKWYYRFGARPLVGETTPFNNLRPRLLVMDMQARQRGPASPRTAEQIAMQYGMPVRCMTTSHNLEGAIDHANAVLSRVQISPDIADSKPNSGGVRYPSIRDVFLYWKWLDGTAREARPKPQHDIYSHGGTAFLYGIMTHPAKVQGEPLRRRYPVDKKPLSGYNATIIRSGDDDMTGIPVTDWN
jgi:hypothetical protein